MQNLALKLMSACDFSPDHIEISRDFKENVVEPILKVQ